MSNLTEEHSKWDELAQSSFRKMEKWWDEHPKAIFVERKQAVDQRLAQLRNQMLGDSSQSQGHSESQT